MKDLRIRFTVLALGILVTAQIAVFGWNAWTARADWQRQQGEQVTLVARLAGEAYATRRTQNVQLANRLTQDAELAEQAFRGSVEGVERRINRVTPLSEAEFVALTDTSGRVLTVTSGGASQFEQQSINTALQSGADVQNRRLLNIDGRVVSIHSQVLSVRDTDFRLTTGFDIEHALTRSVHSVSGDETDLSVSSGLAIEQDDRIPLVLEQDGRVAATLTVGIQSLPFGWVHPNFWSEVVTSLLLLSLSALVCAVGFSQLIARQIERPVTGLRRAIRTIKEGRLQEPVRREACAPFHNVAHDLEVMREALCDRENRIMHHAEYDALTGLTNRTVIAEKLKQAMSRASRNGTVISALAIDLSRFSEINGSMGHEAGDEVLKEIARRLASNARVTDTVARVGGDEFFIILEDNDTKLAQSLARFMVSSLTTAIRVNGSEVKLNVHAGVAFFPQHCDSAEALRRMANIGLYTAKEQGKMLVVYEPGQDEKHLRELAIIHDLPNAIKNDQLYLQYQPKIDMETQQVKQVEALVRWRHPQLGFIPPDEFIALLEKSGMISKLTNWVFKEAIRQTRAWMDAGYDLGVAVNISANDLSDDKLAERLKLLLHHYLVDASKITIEVTESAVITDPENSVRVLNELRSAGVRCSLDDFGTGQTSLALLKQLPISELKIDKSFVQNLRADSGDAIIVKSIIDLGHNMGLHVTAEGVESNYCWNLLNSYGCNLIQGYLISAPLTADELTEWHLRLQDRHINKLDLSFVHDMTA